MSKLITNPTERHNRSARLKKLRRERTSLNQTQAGEFFGLSSKKARDAIAGWESGEVTPQRERHEKFIEYLRDVLKLSEREMHELWQSLMVEVWGFPPLGQKGDQPSEILPPTYPFIGREDKVDEIVSHLQQTVSSGVATVCLIWGMGGVGKTELARAVASRLRSQLPDGQLLIDLRGQQLSPEKALSPSLGLRRIVTLFTANNKLSEDEAELTLSYRSALARRRMLILADDARSRAQVEPFIPPAGSALIVTSREHIELGGQSFLLDTLILKEATSLLLEINSKIGGHAPELARLCACLPLALRICASLLKHTPQRPATFTAQLRAERLKHMVGPNESADDPSASVEASLRLSYDALTPALQGVMQQLSVFPSDFALATAQAVVEGVEDVGKALSDLYLRSMVQWHEETERYSLHDLVREFCQRHLAGADAVHLRHARHYAAIAQQAEELFNAGEQIEGLALFDGERAHIDAAWAWMRARVGSLEVDTLLVTYGNGAFQVTKLRYKRREEHLPSLQATLDAARRLQERVAECRALNHLGHIYYLLGDFSTAGPLFEQALAIARQFTDRRMVANLLNNVGLTHLQNKQHERAIELFRERITIAQDISDSRGEAAGLSNLGLVHLRDLKQPAQALSYFTQYLDLSRGLPDSYCESEALTYLGETYLALGDEEQAAAHWEQSRQIDEKLGDEEGVAVVNGHLGRMLAQRDPKRALLLLEQSYEYLSKVGHNEALEAKVFLDEVRQRVADG